jgi:hypothetical protein
MLACVHLVGCGIQCSCDQRVDFDAQVVSDRGKRICRGEDAPGSTRCRKFPAMRTRPQRWRVAPAGVASCHRAFPHTSDKIFVPAISLRRGLLSTRLVLEILLWW